MPEGSPVDWSQYWPLRPTGILKTSMPKRWEIDTKVGTYAENENEDEEEREEKEEEEEGDDDEEEEEKIQVQGQGCCKNTKTEQEWRIWWC